MARRVPESAQKTVGGDAATFLVVMRVNFTGANE